MTRFVDRVTKLTSESDNEFFEDMDDSSSNWFPLAKNLSAMALLKKLDNELEVSLVKLQNKGFGFYREQVREKK